MNAKRKQVQDLILDIVTTQEPEGYNRKYYEEFFENMDDQAFDRWMRILRDNKNAKIKLLVPPLKVTVDNNNAFKAAKKLGIKVFERLKLWDPIGKRHVLTPHPYLILRLHVRRLKQYLQDGISVPDSDRRLNPLTDQVVKPDKGSAISYPQALMISEKGLNTTLDELMTIRGGDLEAYSKMKTEIEEMGDSDTSVMHGTKGVKSAQTLRSFLQAMHIETNL